MSSLQHCKTNKGSKHNYTTQVATEIKKRAYNKASSLAQVLKNRGGTADSIHLLKNNKTLYMYDTSLSVHHDVLMEPNSMIDIK